MADTVEAPEVVNEVEETVSEKEVTAEVTETATPTTTTEVEESVSVPEPEEVSKGEQNGSGNGHVHVEEDVPKENGTAKEENGTAPVVEESAEEVRKRKSVDPGDATDLTDAIAEKKAKLEEKSEVKQDEVVETPAEQIAA